MTIPFYKLQLAGNGFILVDTGALPQDDKALASDRYPLAARHLCDKRYGVGATAVVFLARDNAIRVFNAQGIAPVEADDAYLCAARFAFDSGRIKGKSIVFKAPLGEKKIDVLGAHEFRLSIGAPFSLLSGTVITGGSSSIAETIERDGTRASYSAIHIHEDAVVAFPSAESNLGFAAFGALVQKAFPGRSVMPVVARSVTRETLLLRAIAKRESGACTAAAAALTAAVCAGTADGEAIAIFEQTGTDGQPDAAIARDRDNSRRLAVIWDTEQNDLSVIGSGGYLFEGKFDLADENQ